VPFTSSKLCQTRDGVRPDIGFVSVSVLKFRGRSCNFCVEASLASRPMSLFHLKLGERKTKSCETVTPGCTDSSINVRLAVSYLQFPQTCGGACSVRVRLNVGRSLHAAGINVITYHERVRAISPHSHVDKKLSLHVETRGGLLACRSSR